MTEAGVEGLAGLSRCRGEATDHAIVANQLLEDAAGQHPLRAISDVELLAAQAVIICDHLGNLFGCAYGRGGFQKHEIAWPQYRRDGTRDGKHVIGVGLGDTISAATEARGHSNYEHIRGSRFEECR